MKKIFLSSPHMCGKEEEYVKDAFKTNWIAPLGPHVNKFEEEVAKYVGAKSAAALSSGTCAIHLALIALGVSEGDKVFCSDLTFAASCNPIIYQRAIPIFIDSEPVSFNMSPTALEEGFKNHIPKAVIVVNLYGQSADMDKILDICKYYKVPVIEDAAESFGATYKNKMSGTLGDFGVFSFNGNKIITTSGGGMLVSNNEEAILKAKFRATQARESFRFYQHKELGFNYRMSNVCAAIGRGQLTAINERIIQKKKIYHRYRNVLEDIGIYKMHQIEQYGKPNYWLSVMTIDRECGIKPIDIILELEKYNIESRPIWKPMHLQPFYKKYPFYSHNNEDVPVSEEAFNYGICLPSDTKMDLEDINLITGILKNITNKNLIISSMLYKGVK